MGLEPGDYLPPIEASREKPVPQVPLSFARLPVPRDQQVAGTTADQQTDAGSSRGMKLAQFLLVTRRKQVRREACRKHRPDFGEGEGARDVEEVAHDCGAR